jgi:hypothetical protein
MSKMKASYMALPHVWINHFVAEELNKYDDCGVNLGTNSVVISPDTQNLDTIFDAPSGISGPLDPKSKYDKTNTPINNIPFFPAAPTNIDQVYNDLLTYTDTDNPLMVSYDRMLRLRPSTFYVHKREQLMYYLYNGSIDVLFNAGNIISQLLDREDEAARDLNRWMNAKYKSSNPIVDESGTRLPLNIFFRNLKVYQADEGRDLLELGTVKTVYTNKYIIEYDYHIKDNLYS